MIESQYYFLTFNTRERSENIKIQVKPVNRRARRFVILRGKGNGHTILTKKKSFPFDIKTKYFCVEKPI